MRLEDGTAKGLLKGQKQVTVVPTGARAFTSLRVVNQDTVAVTLTVRIRDLNNASSDEWWTGTLAVDSAYIFTGRKRLLPGQYVTCALAADKTTTDPSWFTDWE